MLSPCPYCGSPKTTLASTDDNGDGTITQLWICAACGRTHLAEYSIIGIFDERGMEIEEGIA